SQYATIAQDHFGKEVRNMTEERKGQIALLYMKQQLRQNGIKLRPGINRELANQAKTWGITYEEAVEFVTEMYRELFNAQIASLAKPPAPESVAKSKDNFEYD
ncbi:MAG: hypothetical protein AAB392_01060, partial [Patescibacteria group bacterium]